MKRTILAAASGIALAFSSPALAQDAEPTPEEMEEVMAQLSGLFPVDPLTDEQSARLPQARRIIATMIPEGTMGEMMGSMFDEILGPIMELTDGASTNAVATGIGVPATQLDLSVEQAAEAASIFDASWAERRERETAVLPELMANLMTVMEPAMRKAMSELYAIHFSQAELDDIEAFFLTESGASFARKSFTMSSDPRIISATMEAMPAMMQSFANIETQMADATADLPAVRGFGNLTEDEQAQVAAITGYSIEEIRANLGDAHDH